MKNRTTVGQKDALLNALYERFFEAHENFSEVTSSHWREIGWHKVQKGAGTDSWTILGAGFGDRVDRNFVNHLRNFGVNIALSKMEKKYGCQRDLWMLGKEVARRQKRVFSFDCAKQVLSLNKVITMAGGSNPANPLASAGIKKICIIGDGYGYLGTLIRAVDPAVRLTSVNLGRGLLFDAYYTAMSSPESSFALGRQQDGECDFVFLPAEDYLELQVMPQDMIFNIASMQEMNLSVVRNYIHYIRRTDGGRPLFYCCNRRDKRLPDGEIIRFDEYGWDAADEILCDEPCPWYQSYPAGFFPNWHPFDGEILHRLARLAPRG